METRKAIQNGRSLQKQMWWTECFNRQFHPERARESRYYRYCGWSKDWYDPQYETVLRKTAKRYPSRPRYRRDDTYWDALTWPDKYVIGPPHICVYSNMYGKGHEARKYFKRWKYNRQYAQIHEFKRRYKAAIKQALKGNPNKMNKFYPTHSWNYDD